MYSRAVLTCPLFFLLFMLNCFDVLSAKDKWINCDGNKSINDKTDVKFSPKLKINQTEKKKRQNARMRRLVCPKSALMVFSELYKNVPIQIQERKMYTATIKIDGQMHSGNHSTKNQAKQKACENFFRDILKKKLSEQSEKEEKCSEDVELEVGENGSISKPKGPPQEDFPWPQLASLAMHNLINQWELPNGQ
ncbi:mediator of RNA polymerase II transcription subunit 15-like [Aphis craccivora]|uniref:Mediator of RNA polymerase II transcription subunit 15-like n=1 Tax=Aphis craccivora TaxID=307492 RepID=A0A6G0YWX1_APHCR|nr:mediator of RNA polymerase II transcription subunit 15-like [Aphis craccivora]